jgi:hypothetical protein
MEASHVVRRLLEQTSPAVYIDKPGPARGIADAMLAHSRLRVTGGATR